MKEGLHGFIIQAHPDDRALTMGADVALVNAGVRLSYVTFTDGAARKLPRFEDENLLREVRSYEDKEQVSFIGGELYSRRLPDAYLPFYKAPAIDFLTTIIQEEKPDFFITPHISDPHEDHSAAAEIILAIADDIPVYFMDTATGEDKSGNRIRHTHFIPLTRREVRKGKKAFRMNESQTNDLPLGEVRNVFDVMGMPKRVAYELDRPDVHYAAALTLVNFSLGDPITEIFGNEGVIFDREMLMSNA